MYPVIPRAPRMAAAAGGDVGAGAAAGAVQAGRNARVRAGQACWDGRVGMVGVRAWQTPTGGMAGVGPWVRVARAPAGSGPRWPSCCDSRSAASGPDSGLRLPSSSS